MEELSIRAKKFLASHQRFSSTVIWEEVIESFIDNDAPVFEPLIEFQQKYSGYKFLAGYESIHFGILQGDGGYPVRSKTAIIDFRKSRNGQSQYQFVCATSQYEMDFTLDEFGRYYEDFKIVASSFDKFVEHLAIWEEIRKKENFKIFLSNQQLSVQDLDKKLGLVIIPEASDAYTLWFKDNFTYLTQCGGINTIVTSVDFKTIEAMINA